MKNTKITLIAFSLLLSACNAGKKETNIELITAMMDQMSLKAQDWDQRRDGVQGQMLPPENTVPRGFRPTKMEDMDVAKALTNPIDGDMSIKIVDQGREYFTIYCSMCHGDTGGGDGLVNPKLTRAAPTLVSDKVRNYSDGEIFFVITKGFGLMSGYSTQIKDEDKRWAVVNFVRLLQKRAKAGEN